MTSPTSCTCTRTSSNTPTWAETYTYTLTGTSADASMRSWKPNARRRTGPGGVCVFSPQGEHIGTVEVPENVGNLNWGGPDWNWLFIPATSSVYRIQTKVSGNRLPYMR